MASRMLEMHQMNGYWVGVGLYLSIGDGRGIYKTWGWIAQILLLKKPETQKL